MCAPAVFLTMENLDRVQAIQKHTRAWWRKRESASTVSLRVTPYLPNDWSGTLPELLAMPIDHETLIWACCQTGAMPERLAMRCVATLASSVKLKDDRTIFPSQSIFNILEYADGGSKVAFEASKPVNLAQYMFGGPALWTTNKHLYQSVGYAMGEKGAIYHKLVLDLLQGVISESIAV
jgi:hypothetical protein